MTPGRARLIIGTLVALALGPGRAGAQSTLLGPICGLRPALAVHGIIFGLTDTENALANISGGVKQGATLQGVTTATLQIDTGKAFGLPGGTFYVSALQIHGSSLSPGYLDDLQTASGTEASDATRLWELWFDQSFDHGTADLKIGQQSIDQEFIVSTNSALFVNTMAGWPLVPSADLYAGGPAYPLSALGVRLRLKPTKNLTLLAGTFDDNPPGGPFANDPQSLDAGGTKFNLTTGALTIVEADFSTRLAGYPGTYQLGFWVDTGAFPNQTGPSPAFRQHNDSLYGVIDQTLWHKHGSPRRLNFFARLMGAPPDRNLISFSANFGLTLTDPLPGRPNDTAGIDIGIGQISGDLINRERAQADFSQARPDQSAPIQGTETLIELTYQAQLTPWLQLQPDLQYIRNPGGGIANPAAPRQRLQNEWVVGVRTNLTF